MSVTEPVEPAPVSRQPYFAATAVVLGLAGILFVLFWLKEAIIRDLLGWGLIVGLTALALAIGLLVASIVLRSKTKRAGGSQALAIAAIVLSSVNVVLIVGTIVIFVVFVGMVFMFIDGVF